MYTLQRRTHTQLFRHLVDDIANTMDDFDHPTLGKGGFVSKQENINVVCVIIIIIYFTCCDSTYISMCSYNILIVA